MNLSLSSIISNGYLLMALLIPYSASQSDETVKTRNPMLSMLSEMLGGQSPLSDLMDNPNVLSQILATNNPLTKILGDRNRMSQILGDGNPLLGMLGDRSRVLEMIGDPPIVFSTLGLTRSVTYSEGDCRKCRTFIQTVRTMLDNGATTEDILAMARGICLQYKLYAPDVCTGMLELAGPQIVYVLRNTEYTTDTICTFLIGSDACAGDELESWSVAIPKNKPLPNYPTVPLTNPARKILHISDLHVDAKYTVGSPDECGHPLCCREWGDEPVSGSEPAGYWGAKGVCDIPLRTLDLLLEAAATHKPDIIYVTGDFPAHDVWAQNQTSNLAAIDVTVDSLLKAFPDTQIVMTLGNHETAPVNSFPMPSTYSSGFDMHWLYDHLAEAWSQWLPEDSRPAFKLGGYSSYSPFPGFKVLSINTNFCNRLNWWLLLHNKDPAAQLKWLVDQLVQAEENNEKVHIIGHIPPAASDCENSWSHSFSTIVSRFESTITAMFFGHNHQDQWEIMWDADDDARPVAMSYLPTSVTTNGRINPTFRIYYVDAEEGDSTWTVLDHENWSMNLTLANRDNETSFEKIYTASTTYGLETLSPANWANVTYSMATDDKLFEKFLRNYYNFYAEPEEISTCDTECRTGILCQLVTGDSSNNAQCERVKRLMLADTRVEETTQMDHSHHSDPMTEMVNLTMTTIAPLIVDNKSTMDHSHHMMAPAMDMSGTTMDMHGDGGMDMSMSMSFHFGVEETILFEEWSISTIGGLIGSMVGIFLMAVFYEGVKYFREFLFRKSVTSHSYPGSNKLPVPPQERAVQYMDQVLLPSPLEMISPGHFLQTLLHMVQFLVSYFLMLIFMTYNVWLCLAVLFGSGFGYFLFGWKKAVVVDMSEHCH